MRKMKITAVMVFVIASMAFTQYSLADNAALDLDRERPLEVGDLDRERPLEVGDLDRERPLEVGDLDRERPLEG